MYVDVSWNNKLNKWIEKIEMKEKKMKIHLDKTRPIVNLILLHKRRNGQKVTLNGSL